MGHYIGDPFLCVDHSDRKIIIEALIEAFIKTIIETVMSQAHPHC